jgi:hypothetical protein
MLIQILSFRIRMTVACNDAIADMVLDAAFVERFVRVDANAAAVADAAAAGGGGDGSGAMRLLWSCATDAIENVRECVIAYGAEVARAAAAAGEDGDDTAAMREAAQEVDAARRYAGEWCQRVRTAVAVQQRLSATTSNE